MSQPTPPPAHGPASPFGALAGAPAQPVAEASTPRRKRRWPLIVTLVVVAVVLVGGWFAAEFVAREVVTSTIRTQITQQLALPADHAINIELEGSVLTQLIAGDLTEVRIASNDVPLGSVVGDVVLVARGVPVRDKTAPMDAAAATIAFDQANLQQLVAAAPGVPNGTVALSAPEVLLSTSIPVLGFPLELGVGLVPSAGEGEQLGDLMLTPNSVSIAGASLTAEQVRAQFGSAATAILKPIDVCIAQWLPSGATVKEVAVRGSGSVGMLLVGVDIDGRILGDPALQAYGTC